MSRWLIMIGAVTLITAVQVDAQPARGFADPVLPVAAPRVIDMRLSPPLGLEQAPPIIRELMVNQRIAGNAAIGLGLANFYARRKGGSDWRLGGGPARRARKPALTFLLKF